MGSRICPRVAAMASKKAESDLKVSYPVAIEGCCAAANQIRPFGECDGLLGFATLQKALDAAFHPDKLRQISFRSLRMKLGSQRSPRAVFPGNFELRPIDLRSDGSEGHLAGINVWEFGVGQFLVALHGRKERVPLEGDLRVGRQTVQVHQPLCLSDC